MPRVSPLLRINYYNYRISKLQEQTYGRRVDCITESRPLRRSSNTLTWQPICAPALPVFRKDINFQLAKEEQGASL